YMQKEWLKKHLFKRVETDTLGRRRKKKEDFKIYDELFKEKMEPLNLKEEIKPIVTGKDLINMGMKPGKDLGKVKNIAFEWQLEGMDRGSILERLEKEIFN